MTKRIKSNEQAEFLEQEEQQQAEQAESAEESVFDFTGEIESFDAESKRIYYLLRRAAILDGDESRLPAGKQYSKAQVVEILGEDYARALVADTKCCG